MDKLQGLADKVRGKTSGDGESQQADGSSSTTAPAQVIMTPVVPLRMSTAPPYPPAPTQYRTWDEEHLIRQNMRLNEKNEADAGIDSGMENLKGDGKTASERAKGLWGVLSNGVKKGLVEVQSGASSTFHGASTSSEAQRYVRMFPYLHAQGAEYRSSHSCDVVHQGVSISVSVFITSTHICINGSGLNDTLPYKNIVSIVPGVALETYDLTAFIFPLPQENVRPTAVDIYVRVPTMAGQVGEFVKYQFLNIIDNSMRQLMEAASGPAKKYHPPARLIADMDKSWRAVVSVPVPDVHYQGGALSVSGGPPAVANTAAVPQPVNNTRGVAEDSDAAVEKKVEALNLPDEEKRDPSPAPVAEERDVDGEGAQPAAAAEEETF